MTAIETSYTPGPWIVDDRHIHPSDGRLTYPRGQEPETDVILMVDTDCHDNGLLNETDKANLRLAAAAPELLGVCQFAERAYQVFISVPEEDRAHLSDIKDRLLLLRDISRNAIHNATA